MVLDEGEPYGTEVRAVEDELETFHGAIPLLRRRRPAPLLMLSGFTDDLFPFEVTSVLLLVAIVGVMALTKRRA